LNGERYRLDVPGYGAGNNRRANLISSARPANSARPLVESKPPTAALALIRLLGEGER
jgi:hypothetical protein